MWVVLRQLFWIPTPFKDIGRCIFKKSPFLKLTLYLKVAISYDKIDWLVTVINCHQHVLIVICHQWVLVVINKYWPSSWQFMIIDDDSRHSMAIDDNWWQMMTIDDKWWQLMTIDEYLWLILGFDHICTYVWMDNAIF